MINEEISFVHTHSLFRLDYSRPKPESPCRITAYIVNDKIISVNLLAWQDAFRTFEWEAALPDPGVAMKQIGQLLALV